MVGKQGGGPQMESHNETAAKEYDEDLLGNSP